MPAIYIYGKASLIYDICSSIIYDKNGVEYSIRERRKEELGRGCETSPLRKYYVNYYVNMR